MHQTLGVTELDSTYRKLIIQCLNVYSNGASSFAFRDRVTDKVDLKDSLQTSTDSYRLIYRTIYQ
jgi:hypothetical protein